MAKYKEEFADQLPTMFANGESVAEVCQVLGVTRRAFYDWVDKYPEFAAAYEEGKGASEAWWTKLGRAGATGKVGIQPTVWIFNMKNRFDWRDKTDHVHSGPGGGPIETISREMTAEEAAKIYSQEVLNNE